MKKLFVIVAALAPLTAQADLPYTFAAGQPARASEVNANFQAVNSAAEQAITSVSITNAIASGEALAAASCPAGTTAISAGCDCNNEDGASNFGVLFGCEVSGNSAIVGCFPESSTYNSSKPLPTANVYAKCLATESATAKALQPPEIAEAPEVVIERYRRQIAAQQQAAAH